MSPSSLARLDKILTSADNSPVVTPKHLVAFADAIIGEVNKLLAPIREATEAVSTCKLKAFSSIAELRRATGLSRERIVRLLHNNPGKVRAVAPNEFSPYKRYNTRDFLKLVSLVSTPSKPQPQP